MNREKAAFLVFALCVVLGFAALCTYMFFGHNWNVVASKVDDAASDMKGYYVLCYEGLGTDAEDAAKEEAAKAKKAAAKAKRKAAKAGKSSHSSKSAKASKKSSSKKSSSSGSSAKPEEKPVPVSVADVVSSYEEKQASALRLHSKSKKKYRKPAVQELGDIKVGIVRFEKGMTAKEMQRLVDKMYMRDAKYILAFAPSKYYVRNVEGLNVVVSMRQVEEKGSPVGGPYYAPQCPSDGAVAIVISPHGVISSRVIPAGKPIDRSNGVSSSSSGSSSSAKSSGSSGSGK